MRLAADANAAHGPSSRPSDARAGTAKRQALRFVTIPEKAVPFNSWFETACGLLTMSPRLSKALDLILRRREAPS